MSKLTIREASVEDLRALITLLGQDDMAPSKVLTEKEAHALFTEISKTVFHYIYVAELESEIIGTFTLITVQQLSYGGARSVVLEDVVIKTSYQGKGIGQEMMEMAAEKARSLGCSKIILSTSTRRVPAQKFYEHLGYKKDGYRYSLYLNQE